MDEERRERSQRPIGRAGELEGGQGLRQKPHFIWQATVPSPDSRHGSQTPYLRPAFDIISFSRHLFAYVRPSPSIYDLSRMPITRRNHTDSQLTALRHGVLARPA